MANFSSPVAEALGRFFESSSEPILFAGAGVSALAGLPDWKNLLTKLSELLRPVDPMTANQMAHYVAKGSLTKAADFFWITDEMVDGDKHQALKAILSDYNSKALTPLASLPFKGILTTNFDRSIFDAIVAERKVAPRDYRLGDASLKEAVWESELHVTRIHGCIEVPSAIVLSENQFSKLSENDTYIELLTQTFLHKSILFIGFSFYDPAIKHVLEQINKRFGTGFPGRHLAILPDSNASDLIQKAARLNIDITTYDPSNRHAALWHGVGEYAAFLSKTKARPVLSVNHPHFAAKQYLAACYARAGVAGDSVSLREVVLEGVLSEMLQKAIPKSLAVKEIYESIRLVLGIKETEISKLVDSSLKALVDAKLVRKHRDKEVRETKYAWIGKSDAASSLDDALRTLESSILNRAYVQEGWKPPKHVADTVMRFLKDIIHQRGWDLGAAFASGKAPNNVSIHALLAECASRLTALDMERLERTIESVLQRPTEQESKILGELGRVSFMLELAFQAPRTTLLHKTALPRRLYFDTNILLPIFVENHPHYKTFRQTLKNLQDASNKASAKLNMFVFDGYVNEMFSHKNSAVTYAKEAGDDFDAISRSDAILHGSGNINVYVGAYVNSVEYGKQNGFELFLNRVAPYQSEGELRRWIERQGFTVVSSYKNAAYGSLYGLLERCNATRLYHGKEPVLVEHDALQMSLLETDHERSEKAIFISADRQLYDDILNSQFGHLADYMVSHVGIVQLVDLIVGIKGNDRSLGELLWNSNISEPSRRMRSYLTFEALSKYDAALAMKMHQVIEAQSEEISKQLQQMGANLDTFDPKDRVNGLRSLVTFESNFFTGMSEAIDKASKA